jgi:hypothetical protein
MKDCVICSRPARNNHVALCTLCHKAFAETDGEDMITVIEWVAKRTRYFESRRPRPISARAVKLVRQYTRLEIEAGQPDCNAAITLARELERVARR